MRNNWILFCFLLFLVFSLRAQKNVTTFGIQLKPIIPSNVIGSKSDENIENNINFKIENKAAFSFGMVARYGFSDLLSFETGLNFTRRNFRIEITDNQTNIKSDFKFITYDVPLLALVYVQLGEQFYMNAAGGFSIDFLPSDWETSGSNFRHVSYRTEWLIPSLLANVGFEYRSYKSGYFYIGSSYHLPFRDLTSTNVAYYRNGNVNDIQNYDAISNFKLQGSYLTLDLRYFFNEDPIRRTKRK